MDQVSFPLVREPQLSTLAKVRATQAFPILWFEETTEVTKEDNIMFEIQNVEWEIQINSFTQFYTNIMNNGMQGQHWINQNE